jgi:hypothetical protein
LVLAARSLRADLTRSQEPSGGSAICAQPTAGVDVNPTFADRSVGR